MRRESELSLDRIVRGSFFGRISTRLLFGLLVVILLAPFAVMML